MTVVPADHRMTLICDGCGDTVTAATCVLPDAEVVWTLVFENGWAGSPFAAGPHHCPRCSLAPPAGNPPGDTAGDSRAAGGHGLGIDYLEEVGAPPAAREVDPAEAVRRALAEAIELGDRLLVELAEVDVIDSAALGLLVRAHQEARQRGTSLCLVAPSRFVLTVLHTMRLDGLFPVFESRTAALSGSADPATAIAPPPPDPAVVGYAAS